MTKISLTKGKRAIIDKNMSHLKDYSWCFHHSGYARRGTYVEGKYRETFLHHAIVGFPLKGLQVDHINGNRLDNRKSNLRIVSPRDNSCNKILKKEGKTSSCFVGVYKPKNSKKWRSHINIYGKQKYLGSFDTEVKAAAAYQEMFKLIEESK